MAAEDTTGSGLLKVEIVLKLHLGLWHASVFSYHILGYLLTGCSVNSKVQEQHKLRVNLSSRFMSIIYGKILGQWAMK